MKPANVSDNPRLDAQVEARVAGMLDDAEHVAQSLSDIALAQRVSYTTQRLTYALHLAKASGARNSLYTTVVLTTQARDAYTALSRLERELKQVTQIVDLVIRELESAS